VPWRSSPLTRLLRPLLEGGAATAMVATVSPAAADAGKSINTLSYAAGLAGAGAGT